MNSTVLSHVLTTGLEQMQLVLDDAARARLMDFVSLLTKWNAAYNLTAVREPEAMVRHLLLDSLTVLPFLQGRQVIDIGSGAGLPGIPLAIASPQVNFLLLDSNGKKTRFLIQAKSRLGLNNVAVFRGRVEDYPAGPGFDTVVCRALAGLPKLVAMGGHLLNEHGIFVAQKGQFPAAELEQLPAEWSATVKRVPVPSLEDRERHIVVMRPVLPSS